MGNAQYGLGWLADSDRGWFHDDTVPLQELVRQGDTTTLRLNLIATPTTLTAPRTIEFALIATPAPPAADRDQRLLAHRPGARFWPRRARRQLRHAFPGPLPAQAVGSSACAATAPRGLYIDNIYQGFADPDARYLMPEWEDEPRFDLSFDSERFRVRSYGTDPWAYRSRRVGCYPSRTDYLVYWMNRWLDDIGEDGLYLDDTFPYTSTNVEQPGCGYVREDGTVQGAFHQFETREYLKRIAALTQSKRTRAPHTILHMTGSMVPAVFSFSEIYMDGENDHIRTGKDFMDYWGIVRMEVFGAGGLRGQSGLAAAAGLGTPARDAQALLREAPGPAEPVRLLDLGRRLPLGVGEEVAGGLSNSSASTSPIAASSATGRTTRRACWRCPTA